MAREIIRCPYCDRIVPRRSVVELPIEIEDGIIKGVYWCYPCQRKFEFVSKAMPKGRGYTIDGYINIHVPGRGSIREHRYVWEKHNKKPLPQGYVIHHINGIKDDNRIENLIAIPRKSHSQHLETTNRINSIKQIPPPSSI